MTKLNSAAAWRVRKKLRDAPKIRKESANTAKRLNRKRNRGHELDIWDETSPFEKVRPFKLHVKCINLHLPDGSERVAKVLPILKYGEVEYVRYQGIFALKKLGVSR